MSSDNDSALYGACSLVSSAFIPLSRKHIFASVEINNPSAPNIDAFVNLIERDPEIGRKIDYCMSPMGLGKLTKLKSVIWHYSPDKLKWMTQMSPALLHLMQLPRATSRCAGSRISRLRTHSLLQH